MTCPCPNERCVFVRKIRGMRHAMWWLMIIRCYYSPHTKLANKRALMRCTRANGGIARDAARARPIVLSTETFVVRRNICHGVVIPKAWLFSTAAICDLIASRSYAACEDVIWFGRLSLCRLPSSSSPAPSSFSLAPPRPPCSSPSFVLRLRLRSWRAGRVSDGSRRGGRFRHALRRSQRQDRRQRKRGVHVRHDASRWRAPGARAAEASDGREGAATG